MTAEQHTPTSESTCSNAGGFSFLWSAFSLVPLALMDEDHRDLWLNFMRDRIPHDQQMQQVEIASQGCVCLYEGRKGQEDRMHVIPYLIDECAKHEATAVVAIRQGERLAAAAMKDGKLQMANIFESSTKEQTLYWILSIYEQLELPQETPLYIRCGASTHNLLNAHVETRGIEN